MILRLIADPFVYCISSILCLVAASIIIIKQVVFPGKKSPSKKRLAHLMAWVLFSSAASVLEFGAILTASAALFVYCLVCAAALIAAGLWHYNNYLNGKFDIKPSSK